MPFTAKVITTAQWGARDAIEDSFDLTRPMYIVIHNTGDPNSPNDRSKGTLPGAKQLARETQAFHMDVRRWSDSGHNFINTTGGWLLEGRHGTLNAMVKQLQIKLKEKGFDPGTIDSIFGEMTRIAVIAFQTLQNIPADGIVGEKTRILLGL